MLFLLVIGVEYIPIVKTLISVHQWPDLYLGHKSFSMIITGWE